MSFQQAFKVFTKELRRDKSLYLAYQANIAMAYFDCAHWEGSRDSCKKRHAIGNRAADHFLKLLLTPVRPQKKRSRQAHPPTAAGAKFNGQCSHHIPIGQSCKECGR